MGYHHGNLRSALVDEAVMLARASGPDGVVLREVARQAGVSHNAAYRHFSGRGELLAAVAGVAMAQLAAAMRTGTAAVVEVDPLARARARLAATGRAYVHFALAEPGLFRVAFSAATTPPTGHGSGGDDPYSLLGEALVELDHAGGLAAARRSGAQQACWAAVHGFAQLHLDGPLGPTPPAQREAQLEQLLQVVEHGLRP